jgi:threonine dehydrogenase-like Zn-dependent dehydrogenase
MQQLIFVGPHRLEWREAPGPELDGDGQALVRPIASTTCDLDHLIIRGETPFEGPFAIGHEAIAEVLEVGDGVRRVAPGDVVVVPYHVNCGDCGRCRAGLVGHCEAVGPASSYGLPLYPFGGLFDEVVHVPYADAMLTRVPPGLDLAALASAGDNLTLPVEYLARHFATRPEARVIVAGKAASIALYAADVARAYGASRVVYVDADEGRRQVAEQMGFEATDSPDPELGEFDIAVDASGEEHLLKGLISRLVPEGILEIAGGYFHDVPLPIALMYISGVNVHVGLANPGAHVHRTFELVQSGAIRPEAVVTERLPIEEAAAALAEPYGKQVFLRDPVLGG